MASLIPPSPAVARLHKDNEESTAPERLEHMSAMLSTDSSSNSIYRILRGIKRHENSLYNVLRSIMEDSIFVNEISILYPSLPVIANLRCGLWYTQSHAATCYFKSTDGHTGNWNFSLTRLNIHIAHVAAQNGGCMIVDATKKGKRFPDSLSKTIPIWTCVINRAICYLRSQSQRFCTADSPCRLQEPSSSTEVDYSPSWDCSLHLPPWITDTEHSNVESRIPSWINLFLQSGADTSSLVAGLKKPLRPLWISQSSLIWINRIPSPESWPFTPLLLVSASNPAIAGRHVAVSHLPDPGKAEEGSMDSGEGSSWMYLSGAADDEESWSLGLTPSLFWGNSQWILGTGPDGCRERVVEIVRRSRTSGGGLRAEGGLPAGRSPAGSIHWIGTAGIALGEMLSVSEEIWLRFDSVLNCSFTALPAGMPCQPGSYSHLPIKDYKFDRSSLKQNLDAAVAFVRRQLDKKKTVLVVCDDGVNLSVCICLAVLMTCCDEQGDYVGEYCYKNVSKEHLRKRLAFLSGYHTNAQPSRGNLRQVYNYVARLEIELDRKVLN